MGSPAESSRHVFRTPIVGRTREHAHVRDQLDAALSGQGGVALIGGEAGIGKTTLANALGDEAATHGAFVLTGHAYHLTENPPYGPWTALLAHASARLEGFTNPLDALQADEVGASASQAALFARVRDWLAALALRRPLVLVLEDMHWADPASLDLLRFLARQVSGFPLFLLVTYRTDELSKDHPLYHLLPVLVHEANATRIGLRPLQGADVRALVRTRYRLPEADEDGLVAYLYEHAEGNPFFTGELLRTFEEESLLRPPDPLHDEWALGDLTQARLPALLRQVIDGRLTRLGEEAQRLLAVAAVIGQEVPLAVWEQVAEVAEEEVLDAVEAAAAAHLLEETRDRTGVRFVHALIHEAIYAGVPPSRRRRWHRQAGEVLAMGSHPDPDAVAHHFRQAADTRAIAWLVRAGERAQRLYAWWTAADRFEAALTLMEATGADAREQGWLLYRAARLRRYVSPEQGIAALEGVEVRAAAAGDAELAAYALCDRGTLRCFSGDLRRGLAELEAGVAALDALPRRKAAGTDERVALWVADALSGASTQHGTAASGVGRRGALTIWLGWAGRLDEARALGAQLVAIASADCGTPTSDDIACGDAYLGLAMGYAGLGQPEDARHAFGRARDLFLRAEHHIGVAHSGLMELLWTVVPYQADRVAERQYLAAEAVRAWARASGAAHGPFGAQLPLLLLEGEWVEARQLALEVHDANRERPDVELVTLAYEQGDTDVIAMLTREVLPVGPATEPGGSNFLTTLALLRAQVSLAIDAGDLATAREWLEAYDRWLHWSGAVLGQAEGHLAWSVYHCAVGDPSLACDLATRALVRATEPRQPLALVAAHRLLAELDTAAGRYAEASGHLDEALVLAAACASPYERALTHLGRAEWHAATGDRMAALVLLDEVRAICAPLGAAPALARADALATQLSSAVAPVASGGYPVGLTEREVAVLRLIADGKTNREIGTVLFLSPRTIERHITNAYRKIDARGKADATAYVLRHHLT
jgi:DNA-binding CsgD family transcriptional regulator